MKAAGVAAEGGLGAQEWVVLLIRVVIAFFFSRVGRLQFS